MGLEAEAVSISLYDTDLIPGLLQVEPYARAIFEAGDPPLEPAAIRQRIEARMRQGAADGRRRPAVSLHHRRERTAPLHRRRRHHASATGPADSVRQPAQGHHPGCPARGRGAPGLASNFTVLEFSKPMVNDVIYVEGAVGNIYLESAADLERYRRIFSRLRTIALDQEGSAALVAEILAAHEGGQPTCAPA